MVGLLSTTLPSVFVLMKIYLLIINLIKILSCYDNNIDEFENYKKSEEYDYLVNKKSL